MTTTPNTPPMSASDAGRIRRANHLATYPVVINCPGCTVPIRQPRDTEFTASANWCAGCGGNAPIATPNEPGTADAYADAARVASEQSGA